MNKLKMKMTPFFFIMPAVLLLIVFSFFPIIVAAGISFTDMDLLGLADWSQINFTGLENYIELFKDEEFLQAIYNTFFYVIIGVPLAVGSSFIIAFLLNLVSNWLSSVFRVIFYMPSVTNIVAVAVIWGFLYNNEYGLFNYILSLFDIGAVPWLESSKIAKLSLILLAVWKSNGVSMLIFLAALQSIPKMYYEAAEIDGANRWQKLTKITIPSVSFATFFVVVTTMIGWFQFFEEPFVMTEGGPLNSTNSMALFIYQEGFQYNEFGYGAAGSFVLFAIIIVVTIIQFKIRKIDQKG
ncbi:carbohydrate ABC transporter permease [Lederbergia galactosidilytica]|uniref:Sugar ABC transporter permease n=1 Tax=Lederbergia galactosidilytica TaxID=217031 RepID=A0A0Q9YLX9_9BACI|nr:sugar ABC transporter permease [Lederbergia galactosidilytica]KRG14758.1 sugar ABC transporter permease [Virgibacillus soli]KRG17032.1 sugar ABC transporter permease [Lederbergia galactosidilytica]MBP1915881.1 multiple sugar transport system permease protein [Lederbergia galactosidilytica]OAK67104.1 sugar ABC transporter permease [Lederbergia galactosidilytica]